ncbi:MAG TPA: hypothetical protein VKA27_01500, partial [Sunxiuqinia sp.]|nr:hypothetical protein [Sunxiuqinia sp.]
EEDSVGFWLINADGTSQRRVLPYTLTTPAWSPDGNWIAFSKEAQLYKMPFDGTQFDTTAIVQLTFEGRNFYPTWNPDGKSIAFNESICNDDFFCGIWVLQLESDEKKLIGPYGNFPSWHPFDDTLIYLKGDSVWLYNNKSGTRQLVLGITSSYYNNRDLKYSHDGTKIGFTSALISGGGMQLYIADSDGSDLKKITTSGALNYSWSPEGKIVYLNFDYSRIDETKGTLWIMNVDGSNKHQLTYNHFQIIQ